MPGRPILVDVTRLLTRRHLPAPTGIDRVELAYADRFLHARHDALAVAITPFGPRLMPRAVGLGLVETLAERWREEPDDAGHHPATTRLRTWLAGPPRPSARDETAGPGPAGPSMSRPLLGARALLWKGVEAAPAGAVYLHTSHLRLERRGPFRWLDGRPDIRCVFFIHDLIPIDFPEYSKPGEAERHRLRMDTVSRHGAAAIANSAAVAERFTRHLEAERLRSVPAAVAPLGVESAFTEAAEPFDAARPYFVVCSTIEARKNHLLLLQIWRDLAARMGPATPALVIVGRRGWESESAVDLLDRCPAIRPHVAEVTGLPTGDLARLLAGARALLAPSFAEGYGIPVVEALSVGTAVIASDLPAHREVARDWATLLDPLDGAGWRDAVEAAAAGAPAGRPIRGDRFRPPSWAEHFDRVDAVLDQV